MRSMDWMDDARCTLASAEAFFTDYNAGEEAAQWFCKGCTVRVECGLYTAEVEGRRGHERAGVWGAVTAGERGKAARRAARKPVTA